MPYGRRHGAYDRVSRQLVKDRRRCLRFRTNVDMLLHVTQVRMDLQLYRIDDQNYLVDFRNLGYRSIRPAPSSPTLSQLSVSAASTSYIESASSFQTHNTADELRARRPNAGLPPPPTAASRKKQTGAGAAVEVSSPYLFLECAVRLIVELAR